MKQLFIILALCGMSASCSYGQYGFSATTTGTITISASLSVTYTGLVGTFSIVSASDYLNGQTTNNYAKLEVSANIPWVIKVSANSALFTGSGSASTNMPAGIVGIRVNGTSSFITLTTSQQTLATGNSGAPSSSGNTFNTDIHFNPGFSYNGGNYTLGLVYTLTAQ